MTIALDNLWWIVAAGLLATTLVFLVGVRLLTTPGLGAGASAEPSELEHDPFAVGSTTERRNAFRRKGSSITVLVAEQHHPQPTQEAWVLDRSVGGVGLFLERPKSVGTQLRIRPENAPPMTPFIDVEVKSCNPYEDGWHLNCAFVKSPPYSILLLFG